MTEQPAPREKQPESLESYRERALANGWQPYVRKRPRSLIPHDKDKGTFFLFSRAVRCLLPWTMHDYPGRQRGMVEALGGRYTLLTLKEWQKGRREMSR